MNLGHNLFHASIDLTLVRLVDFREGKEQDDAQSNESQQVHGVTNVGLEEKEGEEKEGKGKGRKGQRWREMWRKSGREKR